MNIAKDFLKENYPEFKGFVEHTIVAEMVQRYAEHYHTLQLSKADVSISLVRAKKYARHQHYLGTQLSEFVEFEDWKQD